MDYRGLVREAWKVTWRYRYLWVLGFLVGGGVSSAGGSSSGWRTSGTDQLAPQMQAMADTATRIVSENLGLVITLGLLATLLGIVFLVLSLIAEGGLTRAVVDIEEGHPPTLGAAWSAGVRMFWRYVGLSLLLAAVAIVVAAVVAGTVALAVAMPQIGVPLAVMLVFAVAVGTGVLTWAVLDIAWHDRQPGWVIAVIAAILFPLALVFDLIAVGVAIVFAQRAIVVDDVGPMDALQRGWQLMRTHLSQSLLAWVVTLVLGTLAGIAVTLALFVVGAPLAALGFALWSTLGLHPTTIGLGALALLVLLVVGGVLAAIANTFMWNFWTLAYMQLERGERRIGAAAA